MTASVDSATAAKILAEATERAGHNAYRISNKLETYIEQIIGHTHLTYKYILLNGMLAKAVNPAVDPLALQAGAPLGGAFDARSLCHSVVVPFEQTVLEKRLGGSNEPFLNKPARFTHLSTDNAVRRGRDREALERLIAAFELVNEGREGSDPREALVAVLAHILRLESRVVTFDDSRFQAFASKRAMLALIENLLARSCEGESLALSVSLLFELLAQAQGGGLIVSSHPTNQSGASSNEISDIDVFEADGVTPRYCCEAKDKPFTRADIDHAASKVAESGHSSMLFVFGPNAQTVENLDAIVIEYEAHGFDLTFMSASYFAHGIVAQAPTVTWPEITAFLNKHLGLMRAKETTIAHCREALAAV